jgi:hypothetical protein
VSTEALSGFNLAAKLAGASTGDVSRALTYMARTIGEAATGSKEYEDALNRVGMTSAQLLRLKPEEQYQRIADGINRLSTQAEKTSAAMDIFGRSGAKMMNLISGGGQAIDQAIAKTKEFGTAVSRDVAAQVEQMNDELTMAGEQWAGIKTTLLVSIVPLIRTIVESTSKWVTSLRNFVFDITTRFPADVSAANKQLWEDVALFQSAAFVRMRNEANEHNRKILEGRLELARMIAEVDSVMNSEFMKNTLTELEIERLANIEKMRLRKQEQAQREAAARQQLAIEEQNRQQASSYLSSMTGQLAGQSKAWFRINKMVAIANAAMNTNEAMTRALAFGPVAGPIMAGVIGAAGLANIAAIRATTFEGGGSVAGAAGGTEAAAPAETAQPQPARTLNLTLQSRNGMVSEDQLLQTLEGLNKLLDDGFTLNTRNI